MDGGSVAVKGELDVGDQTGLTSEKSEQNMAGVIKFLFPSTPCKLRRVW